MSILYRFRDISGYWSKVTDFDPPHLHSAPSQGVTAVEFRGDVWHQKTRVPGVSCGVVCVILRLPVLVELRLVTDGRTDRRTQGHGWYRGCIASRGKNLSVCEGVSVLRAVIGRGRRVVRRRLLPPGPAAHRPLRLLLGVLLVLLPVPRRLRPAVEGEAGARPAPVAASPTDRDARHGVAPVRRRPRPRPAAAAAAAAATRRPRRRRRPHTIRGGRSPSVDWRRPPTTCRRRPRTVR